ncbi:hypothetical protein G3N58_03845 [Paraburkholderia sp. Ac-20342]|nr:MULTISPECIES: hypothetical protein [unclassified Paraburkholderia]MBN3845965.1 hypothetical protein [Paraburkholderia sp. Ac-20342]
MPHPSSFLPAVTVSPSRTIVNTIVRALERIPTALSSAFARAPSNPL